LYAVFFYECFPFGAGIISVTRQQKLKTFFFAFDSLFIFPTLSDFIINKEQSPRFDAKVASPKAFFSKFLNVSISISLFFSTLVCSKLSSPTFRGSRIRGNAILG
jgi:hypothetical protein